MGQKVHPRAFRLGVIGTWKSRWFATKQYAAYLQQDVTIRRYLMRKLRLSGVSHVDIERNGAEVIVNLYTSKPGLVIGRGGAGSEELKRELKKKVVRSKAKLTLNIHEVQNPSQNAQLICGSIVEQLEKRIPFRRAVRRSIEQVMEAGAKGVKVVIGGRLNGAEIARQEKFSRGSVPLHTLRADVDYARAAAFTTYGAVGVKVWINRGEVFAKKPDRT